VGGPGAQCDAIDVVKAAMVRRRPDRLGGCSQRCAPT